MLPHTVKDILKLTLKYADPKKKYILRFTSTPNSSVYEFSFKDREMYMGVDTITGVYSFTHIGQHSDIEYLLLPKNLEPISFESISYLDYPVLRNGELKNIKEQLITETVFEAQFLSKILTILKDRAIIRIVHGQVPIQVMCDAGNVYVLKEEQNSMSVLYGSLFKLNKLFPGYKLRNVQELSKSGSQKFLAQKEAQARLLGKEYKLIPIMEELGSIDDKISKY